MVIGIDLDGVVFDSETVFRTYEEIYDIEELKGNNLIDREEPKHQQRYNWTEEQTKNFRDKYYLEISRVSPLMPGFETVYRRLKEEWQIEKCNSNQFASKNILKITPMTVLTASKDNFYPLPLLTADYQYVYKSELY